MASQDTRGFLAGFLMGAALGAIAGILFTSRPGSELRSSLAETGAGLKQRAADAGRRVRDAADTRIRGAKTTPPRTSAPDGQ